MREVRKVPRKPGTPGKSVVLLGALLILVLWTGQGKPAWGADAPLSGDFVDLNKLGVGLDWDPGEFPGIAEYFVSIRDWITPRFGLEGGVGMGYHPGNPGETLVAFNFQSMMALVERRFTIFYLDATATPSISTNPSWPTTLQLSSGFGIEKIYSEIPELALNLQWNPLVLDINTPNLPVMNGFMNFFVGFHYYFD